MPDVRHPSSEQYRQQGERYQGTLPQLCLALRRQVVEEEAQVGHHLSEGLGSLAGNTLQPDALAQAQGTGEGTLAVVHHQGQDRR
jgi:hypothetical protein